MVPIPKLNLLLFGSLVALGPPWPLFALLFMPRLHICFLGAPAALPSEALMILFYYFNMAAATE
jgi:hypothetical protein